MNIWQALTHPLSASANFPPESVDDSRVSTETPSQKRQKEVDLAVYEGFQRWSASDAPDWKWLQFSLESDPHLFEGYAPVRTIRAAWREQHA